MSNFYDVCCTVVLKLAPACHVNLSHLFDLLACNAFAFSISSIYMRLVVGRLRPQTRFRIQDARYRNSSSMGTLYELTRCLWCLFTRISTHCAICMSSSHQYQQASSQHAVTASTMMHIKEEITHASRYHTTATYVSIT
jgi:hypothetical protein